MSIRRVFLGELTPSKEAPGEFRLLTFGVNGTRKGDILFDEEAAVSVMDEFQKGGVLLPVDFDHAMADPCSEVMDRIAAGWFKPEVREGDLWMSEIEWTDKGRSGVESKEWRYTSLYGDVAPIDPLDDDSPVRLVRLRNVALTNTPATLATLPLVANEGTKEQKTMTTDLKTRLILALGARDESEAFDRASTMTALLSDVANALGTDNRPDSIRGSLKALVLAAQDATAAKAELASFKEQAAAAAKESLIASLSDSGQLPPALHDWARTQSVESLKAFGEKAPKMTQTTAAVVRDNAGQTEITLTEEEAKVASLIGPRVQNGDKLLSFSKEQVLAHKAKLRRAV